MLPGKQKKEATTNNRKWQKVRRTKLTLFSNPPRGVYCAAILTDHEPSYPSTSLPIGSSGQPQPEGLMVPCRQVDTFALELE